MIRVAGEDALELGLLFGTENLTPQEEETDVFCFQHLMLQEFVAAHFISLQDKVGQSLNNFFKRFLICENIPGQYNAVESTENMRFVGIRFT